MDGQSQQSPTIPAGQFHRLLLNNSVFLGDSDFDSLKVTGKTINLPLTTFMKMSISGIYESKALPSCVITILFAQNEAGASLGSAYLDTCMQRTSI